MKLVSLGGAAIRFGATTILRDLTWTVTRGERWGLVGRNGSGKTSLLQLITGEVEPSVGAVARAGGLRVAVVDQHRALGGAETVWDAAAGGFAELRRLEAELAERAHAIGAAGDQASEQLLASYAADLERFEHQGGYALTARVDAVLHGVGFDPVRAREQEVATLSGGERGRVALAAALAAPADLLLLDEPTNHLDLAGTRWLEEYLVSEDRTVVVISHDRAFLDRVTDHTFHLEAGSGLVYGCGFRAFVEQRAQQRLASQRAFEKQAKTIAKEEDYIRRNIAGQNSAQATGRQRRLTRVVRLTPPPDEAATMAVRFVPAARGGDQVLVVEQLGLAVDGRGLLGSFSGTIRRGEVVGLIGPNGAGKSTFLSTVIGRRQPDQGSVKIGDSIRVGYYAQDLSEVPPDRELFDLIHDLRPAWTRGQVQDHLGRFGFSGDSVRRRADSLSGGELARVALATLMLANANFLIFDEPTNHLDVETIEALEDAIDAFDGTVLLVSHDRALLRTLTTRIWGFDAQAIEDYPGSFEEWEARDAARRRGPAAPERRKAAKPRQPQAAGPRPLTAARRRLESAEARVAEAEARVRTLETSLGDSTLYDSGEGARRAAAVARELEQARAEVRQAVSIWEEVSLEVERLSEG
jgi:ATP-binding cassette subfamily F protein 3